MTIILWITLSLIIVYFLYPLFLISFRENRKDSLCKTEDIESISLILLTYNGVDYLSEKIKFLSEELSAFKHTEFIIIDDNSRDGTSELLEKLKDKYNFKIIQKETQKGIADSMNIVIKIAKYDYLIFCDQRQQLTKHILKQIVLPLQNEKIGAVSGYISNLDKNNKFSFIRKHENYLKLLESNIGCLIGVYGPFYAIKKSCYVKIPEHIILEDLYLSLKILISKKIVLMKTCIIVDDSFSGLYNLKRSKRYLKGLFQILFEKQLIGKLNTKLKLMLIWHKYLRLIIPFLLFLSYLYGAYCSFFNLNALLLFGSITIVLATSLILSCFKLNSVLSDVLRTNIYYFISMGDMLFHSFHFINLNNNRNVEIKNKFCSNE